jgi:hypothetical protein
MWQVSEVGFLRGPRAEARVWASAVVERDDRTPTGSMSERLPIAGIHGLGGLFAFMR